MTGAGQLYCLDTSALVNPWNRYYSADIAPGYWRDLQRLVDEGRVVLSEEVREEVYRQRDGLTDWAKKSVSSWYPLTDEVQARLTEVMKEWGKMVGLGGRSRADPIVIATGWALGAAVVTEEGPGSERKPSIPYVCSRIGVRSISVYAFVREAGINLR
jgi:hypothetical protein